MSKNNSKKTGLAEETSSGTRHGLNMIIEDVPAIIWIGEKNRSITCRNTMFLEAYGKTGDRKCYDVLMGRDAICDCCLYTMPLSCLHLKKCENCARRNGRSLDVYHVPSLKEDGYYQIITIEVESNALLPSLQKKPLSGRVSEKDPADADYPTMILAMCASCNKIRDINNEWQDLTSYIRMYFDVKISHGLCLECAIKQYPEFYRDDS